MACGSLVVESRSRGGIPGLVVSIVRPPWGNDEGVVTLGWLDGRRAPQGAVNGEIPFLFWYLSLVALSMKLPFRCSTRVAYFGWRLIWCL